MDDTSFTDKGATGVGSRKVEIMTEEVQQEYLVMPYKLSLPCNFSAGYYMGRFLAGLRDHKKIWGIKCPKCGRIMVPPRQLCGQCHGVEATEWVELGDKGTLMLYDVVLFDFINPGTGQTRPTPWARATIELDGGAEIGHFLEETDPDKLRLGMRVQAVWKEKNRTGEITDILYFRAMGSKSRR